MTLWQLQEMIRALGPRLPGPVPPEEWTEGHFKLCVGPFWVGCIKHEYTDTSRRQYSGGWSQG